MREYIAYSFIGVVVSRVLQKCVYTNSRAHWIRDCLAGNQPFSQLK